MRSLQDWTRYLEQQEQDLQTTPKATRTAAPEPPAPPPARPVEPPKPKDEDVPAFLRAEPVPAPEPAPEPPAKPAKAPAPMPEKLAVAPKPVPEPPVAKEAISKAAGIRKRLPRAIETSSVGEREVARASYKTFKESREELIQRLVDPILTLEEVARILNVCPTTVRRYTNKGAIAHHRTAGNQRRFRLSDVLAFLEQQSGGVQE